MASGCALHSFQPCSRLFLAVFHIGSSCVLYWIQPCPIWSWSVSYVVSSCVPDWFQLCPVLIPAVFQVGFMLYPSQFPAVFHVGSGCVLHGLGLRPILIPAVSHIASSCVPGWFQLCSMLALTVSYVVLVCVLYWFQLCSRLLSCCVLYSFQLCSILVPAAPWAVSGRVLSCVLGYSSPFGFPYSKTDCFFSPFLYTISAFFFLFSCRKHALNCHRMKPALFSVLCEIKEKTGELLSFLLLIFPHNAASPPQKYHPSFSFALIHHSPHFPNGFYDFCCFSWCLFGAYLEKAVFEFQAMEALILPLVFFSHFFPMCFFPHLFPVFLFSPYFLIFGFFFFFFQFTWESW